MRGGRRETAAASALLENVVNIELSKTFTCTLCGKEGFRSAEELGTHCAMCFGDGDTSNNESLNNNGKMVVVAAEESIVDEVWCENKSKTVLPGSVECPI